MEICIGLECKADWKNNRERFEREARKACNGTESSRVKDESKSRLFFPLPLFIFLSLSRGKKEREK